MSSCIAVRKYPYDARVSLFVGARHVPGSIYHSFIPWKELIKILDALCIFVQQFRFAWDGFPSFDQIQDCDGGPISFKEIIEMSGSRRIERIHDTDLRSMSTREIQKKG